MLPQQVKNPPYRVWNATLRHIYIVISENFPFYLDGDNHSTASQDPHLMDGLQLAAQHRTSPVFGQR